ARRGAASVRHVREVWSGEWMERPALATVLPGRGGPVERPLTPAPVEAREMSARQRRPDDAAAIDIHAAWSVSREGRLEHFRQRRRRRIRSRIEPNDVTGKAQDRAPYGPVGRVHGDSVEGRRDPLILGGIDRLVGLHIVVPLAVAVGVEAEGGPTLSFRLVAGLVERLPVQPADDAAGGAAGAGPP